MDPPDPANNEAEGLIKLQRETSMLENFTTIPPFNGDDGSITFLDFYKRLEYLANIFKASDEVKLYVLKLRLSGTAGWILENYEDKGYTEVIQQLKDRFVRSDPPDIALAKFLNFKQTPNMRVQEFYDRAEKLSHKALVVEGVGKEIADKSRTAMLHSMLLSNLSPEIRKGVIVKDPKTPTEVLNCALLEEKALRSISQLPTLHNENPSPSPPQNSYMAANLACAATPSGEQQEIVALREQLNLLTVKFDSFLASQAQNSANKTNIVCYQCSQPGHISRSCPQNQNFSNQNQRGRSYIGNRGNRGQSRGYRGGRNSNWHNRSDHYQNFSDNPDYNNGFGQNNYNYGNRGHYRGNRGNFNQPTGGFSGNSANNSENSTTDLN